MFKVFHRDISLMFQFIYSEYLSCHHDLRALLNFKEGDILTAILLKLTGAVHDYSRLFAYHEGSLAKLKNNCASFMQNEAIQDAVRLHEHADKAWLLCSESLSCLYKNQKLDEQKIQQALDHLTNCGEILKGMILFFKEDENVLFFLLRHQELFSSRYGPDFVRNCFEQIYPDGLDSGLKFLVERYLARGFTHLVPVIENHFVQLCR